MFSSKLSSKEGFRTIGALTASMLIVVALSGCSATNVKETSPIIQVPKISIPDILIEMPSLNPLSLSEKPIKASAEKATAVIKEFDGTEVHDLEVCAQNTNPCPDWPILTAPWAPMFPGDAVIAVYEKPASRPVWLKDAKGDVYAVHPSAKQPESSSVWMQNYNLNTDPFGKFRSWFREPLTLYVTLENGKKLTLNWSPPQ